MSADLERELEGTKKLLAERVKLYRSVIERFENKTDYRWCEACDTVYNSDLDWCDCPEPEIDDPCLTDAERNK